MACSIDESGLLTDAGAGGSTSGGGSSGSAGSGALAASGGSVAGGGDAGTGGTSASGGGAGSPSGGSAGSSTCAAGQQCVPSAPSGWSYAFLAKSAYSATAATGPDCHDASAPQRFYLEPTGAAQCASCACGPLQGGTCSAPLLCAKNKTCSGLGDWSQGDGDCKLQTGSPDFSCQLGPAAFAGASGCSPSGGQLVAADPWKQVADVCISTGASGCASGSDCVPVGTGAYAGSVCVYMPGDQTCPSDYPNGTLVFKKALDTRSCSACVCGSGTASCTGVEYKFYDDGLCASGSKSVNSTACLDLTAHINDFWAGWGFRRSGTGSVTGSCPPSGGQSSGAITGDPASALTICCRPAA